MKEGEFLRRHIHIFGASGSGTTTIAGVVAKKLDYRHFDSDDYFWLPTDPPYTVERSQNERIGMMRRDLVEDESWILSGSLTGWGDDLIPFFDLVIFFYVPPEIRLERLRLREAERYGERIREGGDQHEKSRAFLEWAAMYDVGTKTGRNLRRHEEWMKKLTCPVDRIVNDDLDLSVETVIAAIERE